MGQNGNFVGNYQSQFDLISRPKQAPIHGILLTFMLTHHQNKQFNQQTFHQTGMCKEIAMSSNLMHRRSVYVLRHRQ
jgi:hypothetical protein